MSLGLQSPARAHFLTKINVIDGCHIVMNKVATSPISDMDVDMAADMASDVDNEMTWPVTWMMMWPVT